MNKIYDNGIMLLGTKKMVYDYILNDETLEKWEYEDLLKELEELSNETIVAINYCFGMGYSMDFWNEDDIVKECE